MLLKEILDIYNLLDSAHADGNSIKTHLLRIRSDANVEVVPIVTPKGSTDIIRILVKGKNGRSQNGTAPTIGLMGWLGGIGARPDAVGYVSDGDGALAALSVAAKLLDMQTKGDFLEGDVYLATHICPAAPTRPHDPVPLMDSEPFRERVKEEAFARAEHLDALISCDTTKGNSIINCRGFAISPTVKEGWILKVSKDLLQVFQNTTGELPKVFAVTNQDITPYGNGIDHLNGIMQPGTMTTAPMIGVAITTQSVVAGCATGATHFEDVEAAARFMLETAKGFGAGKIQFYDKEEYERLIHRYGSLRHLQTMGHEQ